MKTKNLLDMLNLNAKIQILNYSTKEKTFDGIVANVPYGAFYRTVVRSCNLNDDEFIIVVK